MGFRRNRGEVAEVVVFASIGDGLQVFGISAVGNADTGDLALFCHVYCLLFFYNGIVGKLILVILPPSFIRPTIRFALEFACGI